MRDDPKTSFIIFCLEKTDMLWSNEIASLIAKKEILF